MNAFPGLVGNVSATVLHRPDEENVKGKGKEKTNEPTPDNIPEYIPANQAAIEAKRASTVTPVYLILGANPGEHSSGRIFYQDPHYWTLGDMTYVGLEGSQPDTSDTSRFFQINWRNPEELEYLASQLPGQFDVICFDYSTAKFFVDGVPVKTIQNNLRAIYTLLKKDGLFIAEMTTMLGGESKRRYYDNLIKNAGFSSQGIGFHTDLVGDRVIRNIYGSHKYVDEGEPVILGLYKKPSRGGKRRQTRGKRKARRKSSRKVPQIIKH